MKFSIFYFSGTGNTKWAVDEFKSNIIKRNHECIVHSIDAEIIELEKIISEADIIGFAFPIYGANMPNIIIKFIDGFKNILNITYKKPSFIITTAGYIDACGPFIANKLLRRNGFRLIGYVNLKLSNNISTPKIRTNFPTNAKMKIRMQKGKEEIESLINRIIGKRRYIKNIGVYLIPGILIRRATRNAQKDNYLALSVNQEKCSKCMLCINDCPTNSIIFSNGEFSFLPSCTSCMKCYNFCPTCAIYHEGKYADPNIYKRYKGPQSILSYSLRNDD